MSTVFKGRVKWFDPRKGYGFIERDDDHAELFVHHTGILHSGLGLRNLEAGERVKFEVDIDPKGPKAVRVTRAP